MSQIGALLDVNLGFRFMVLVDGINYAAFTEFTLPSLQVDTDPVTEGGQNTYVHKLAKRVNPGSITLKHGLSRNRELLEWYLQVMQGDIANATRDVTVVVMNGAHDILVVFTFHRALPIKWSGPSLKVGDGAVAIEELELAYHGFEAE